MGKRSDEKGIKLSGHWNQEGVFLQVESLSTLLQLESGLEKLLRIDCSGIDSVDMSGLQLLYVWMQCVSLRGTKPELINLPVDLQQTIKRLGLEKCFADFYAGSIRKPSQSIN